MANYNMVEITLEEYGRLVEDQNTLYALRAAGVDNWEGYDDAIASLEVEEE